VEEETFALALSGSPLAPGTSAVRIGGRAIGAGRPLVVLHGGWGYEAYPFDRQIAALRDRFRILIPDRTGYGRSGRIDRLPLDFHRGAAVETLACLDALGEGRIDPGRRVVLWGHSDGAVIALHAALLAPDRIAGVVAEATHLWPWKPASRSFFEMVAHRPEQIAGRLVAAFIRDHGPDWRRVITMNGDVWLRLAEAAARRDADLYDGSLGTLQVPVLVVHGAADPRTEPGEVSRLCSILGERPPDPLAPARTVTRSAIFEAGGHSPHSERNTADAVTAKVAAFLDSLEQHPDPCCP
jgi:pimeloyl-ACP methyl ester carboxylesterase